MKKTVAILAATTTLFASGCTGEKETSPPNKGKPKVESSEKTEKNGKNKAVGGKALDGCNIKSSKKIVRQRILDGKWFNIGKVTDKNGNDVDSSIGDKKTIIANPIPLECKGQIIAYLGIAKPMRATTENNINPVRVIKVDNDSAIDASGSETDVKTEEIQVHFPRGLFTKNPKDSVGAFVSKDDVWYGSAIDTFDPTYIPPGGADVVPKEPGLENSMPTTPS